MPRDLTSGMISQVTGNFLRPCFFVQIDFSNETIYVWSGPYPIRWNGQTWQGLGWMGAISAIPETKEIMAQNVTISLSGIPAELLGDTMEYVRLWGELTVWFGCLDSSNNIIANPTQCYQGHLDVPTVTDAGATCTISITAENPLVNLNLPANRRYTDCDQQLDFPEDLGFAMVTLLQALYLQWPMYLTPPS